MADGQYTPEERAYVESVARQVVGGELKFGEAVEAISQRLGRNPRGVKLYLGRVVAKVQSGARPRGGRRGTGVEARPASRRRGRGRRRRMSFEGLVAATKEKAEELQGLRRRRDELEGRISVLEAELRDLQAELLKAIGLGGGEG